MDSRRTLWSLALVVLVALAGCSSGPLGGSPGDAAPQSVDDLSLPDGASPDAVENASALAAAHTQRLSERGYEVRLSVALSGAGESRNRTYLVRRDADSRALYQRVVRGANGTPVVAYVNETASYQKQGVADPSYDVDTATTSDGGPTAVAKAPESLVPLGEWTDPSAVSRDGQTLVRYDLDGISPDAQFVDADQVSNASGSLLVDQQGVVHRVALNVTRERDGATSTARYEYRVTDLGDVAVEKPEWVSEAAAQQEEDDGAEGEVTSRVLVVAASGTVEDGRITRVDLVVKPRAGADDIDLSTSTVQWIGPESATTLVAGGERTGDTFTVEAVKDDDDSIPVLDSPEDRAKLSMNASAVGGGLEPGDEVKLTVTTEYGAATVYWVVAPEDLSGESVVSV